MEAPVVKSLADLPKLAEPAPEPHSVEIKLSDPRSVIVKHEHTADVPRPPNKAARDEWIFEKMRAGGDQEKLARKLNAVGWDIKPQSVYAQYRLTRRQKGFEPGAPRPRAKKAECPVKHIPLNTFRPEPERVEHTAMPAIDPLVLAIAEAIAPLIRDQLANQRKDMEALKAKADKWDAISGLVREA